MRQPIIKGVNANGHRMAILRMDAARSRQIILGKIFILQDFSHINYILIHASHFLSWVGKNNTTLLLQILPIFAENLEKKGAGAP